MVHYYKKSYSPFAPKRPSPDIHVPSDYARRLRGLRRTLGLSQSQLATKIGAAGKAVIYQWESEKRHPSPVFWRAVERFERKK
jgi:ribosome-binding protein aMBF1 (putative translation factor)